MFDEDIRRDQQHHASRMSGTLRLRSGAKKGQKSGVKGHEAFLKALEASGALVTFEKIGSGEAFSGTIKTSDKFTISIQCGELTRVLFKHAIAEFSTAAPRREEGSGGDETEPVDAVVV